MQCVTITHIKSGKFTCVVDTTLLATKIRYFFSKVNNISIEIVIKYKETIS